MNIKQLENQIKERETLIKELEKQLEQEKQELSKLEQELSKRNKLENLKEHLVGQMNHFIEGEIEYIEDKESGYSDLFQDQDEIEEFIINHLFKSNNNEEEKDNTPTIFPWEVEVEIVDEKEEFLKETGIKPKGEKLTTEEFEQMLTNLQGNRQDICEISPTIPKIKDNCQRLFTDEQIQELNDLIHLCKKRKEVGITYE